MPDTIDRARTLIKTRLAELEAEAAALEQALRSIAETTSPSPRRRRKSRRRGKRAKPAPRGQRAEQFLAAVEAKPGAKISEIAVQIGTGPNQLYPLAKRLQKQKKIRKSGPGFRLAAPAKPAKTTKPARATKPAKAAKRAKPAS